MKKNESIILSEIKINNEEILIPVIDKFRNICKIFYYSNHSLNSESIEKAKKIYNTIKLEYKIGNLHIYTHQKPMIKKNLIVHNIYIKNINSKDKLIKTEEQIKYFNKLPNEIKKTFSKLGGNIELNNFYFLWKMFILKNKKLKPIICAVVDNKIIGAIGPLDIIRDSEGKMFLLPPNFGILKKNRKHGIGSSLWRSAMYFAFQKGAKYTLVQNIPNSPAAKFYENCGLVKANVIYSFVVYEESIKF